MGCFSRSLAAATLALACLPLASPHALAWGDEGHKAIAVIAYSMLSPMAKSQVDALLLDDPTPPECGGSSFVAGAVWPDKLREKPRKCSSGLDWGKTAPPDLFSCGSGNCIAYSPSGENWLNRDPQ